MQTILLGLALGLATVPGGAEDKAVRTYTNQDLARVSPYRDQTGATSTRPPKDAARPSHRPTDLGQEEQHWRREAERLRERLRPLRREAATLRLEVEEARRRPAGRSQPGRSGRGGSGRSGSGRSRASGGSSVESLDARLRLVEAEMRERESDLEDRARRAGALPGWLR